MNNSYREGLFAEVKSNKVFIHGKNSRTMLTCHLFEEIMLQEFTVNNSCTERHTRTFMHDNNRRVTL